MRAIAELRAVESFVDLDRDRVLALIRKWLSSVNHAGFLAAAAALSSSTPSSVVSAFGLWRDRVRRWGIVMVVDRSTTAGVIYYNIILAYIVAQIRGRLLWMRGGQGRHHCRLVGAGWFARVR